MGKLKEISKHPLASALAAAMTTVGGALSAVGVFPASPDLEGRFWWLAAWFGTTVALGTWSYFTWHLRWRLLIDPKAMIVFDSRDSNHVQHGLVDVEGSSAGSKEPCDEYLYALGIVSLSAKPVSGCRLVLEGSAPHNPSEQRLARSMKVRNDPHDQSAGEFTLNPGDRPGVYVEVLQEVVPHSGGMGVPGKIRLKYANTNRAQENWFTQRGDHVLTFRLEGDFAKPIRFRLSVTYDERRRRWKVEPSDRPLPVL